MTLNYEEIGKNIKLCRVKRRLKQAELAEMVGVSSQHISHIECGRTKLGLPLLLHISEVLSADLYTLLGDNVLERPDGSIDAELSILLKGASKAQRTLCLALCRTVMEYGEEVQSM